MGRHRVANHSLFVLALAAAAVGAGCGGESRRASRDAEPAPKPAAAPVSAVLAALTPAQSATASAAHDQFASAGLQCASCHPCGAAPNHGLDWMDQSSPGFHAYGANAGLASCQGCHGARLDGVGGATSISCAACHGASWATTCTMCHGGTDNQTGAPPKAIWGNSADAVRVGAHSSHLTATAMAPAFDCGVCHVTPADAFAAGHIDGASATVAFAGLAVASGATPAWSRPSATCSNVYCHGATLSGGTNVSPVWTAVGQGQAACGTCHGLPPTSGHPAVTGGLTACASCHPATMDPSGNLIPPSAGGKHLDGVVEATGGHPASWMDQTSTGFHAYSANAGLSSCQGCHGQDLSGGSAGVSCASCHGAAWKTTCTMCHGGVDNQTGAPPKATWGNSADPIRGGTHTSHVAAAHSLSAAIACTACHVTPTDALAAGHIDAPTATVTFAGLAVQGGLAPTWTRGTATCASTYCHGATLAGGAQKSPIWTTADGSQRACGSCHGAPPQNPYHTRTDLSCGSCHAGYTATTVAPATHVDGKLDYAVTCTSCHGDSTRAATTLNPNLAAAPPKGTHGETATTALAVGAHQTHLAGGTISSGVTCDQCHAIPSSMTHANGTVALTWGALATTGGAAPTWTRSTATCAANWCHGAKLTGGTDTTPIWTKVDGTQDACGTCHGRPPTSGRHGQSEHRVSCGYCHAPNYTTTAVDKAFHVNGTVEVQGSRIRSYNYTTHSCSPSCHGTETWR